MTTDATSALRAQAIALADDLEGAARFSEECGNEILESPSDYTPDDPNDIGAGLLHQAETDRKVAAVLRQLPAALTADAADGVRVPKGWVLVPMVPPEHSLGYLRVPTIGNWQGMLSLMPVPPRAATPPTGGEHE